MNKKNFYSLLGVTKNSSAEEIRNAYKRLALKFHPDKNSGDKKAEEKFKEISEAYETLADPKKKLVYDQFGFTNPQQNQESRGPSGSGPRGPHHRQSFDGFNTKQGPFGPDDFRKGTDFDSNVFGDLFEEMFGQKGYGNPGEDPRSGARGAGRTQRKQKGTDLRYTLNVTLEESANGCEKTISFIRQKGGRDETAHLSVKIPPGVTQHQRLKLTGEGDSGLFGGPSGDLYAIINILEHSLFKREEDDVLLIFPISYLDAILGTTVEVPTLSNLVSLKIPPGTHAEQVFRLKGRGFPRKNGYGAGDMRVQIIIDIPKSFSSKEKEVFEEFAKNQMETPLVKLFKEKVQTILRNRK